MNEKEALLNQIRSVHVPEVSSLPAVGWWLLLLSVVLLALVLKYMYTRRRVRLWHREAKAELERIRASIGQQQASVVLSDASKLARRVLLKTKTRQTVANLHGSEWLHALDDISGKSLFVDGFGSLLGTTQYQRDPQVKPADLHSLMDALQELISSSVRQVK